MKNEQLEKTRTISGRICDWIAELNVEKIFMVPGAQIDPLSEEVATHESVTPVVACHELGAGYMADGYARASLKPGICMSIGGPGASYMLASSIVARVENVPVFYITGDIPTWLMHKNYAFQDTGINGSRDHDVYKAAIDYSEIVRSPAQINAALQNAYHSLKKNLPAHMVVPIDLQESKMGAEEECQIIPQTEHHSKPEEVGVIIAELISQAKLPVLLVGHRSYDEVFPTLLKKFAEKSGVLVATTMNAKGILPEIHSQSLGNFGFAGTVASMDVILGEECDLLIVLGSNLGQRDTLNWDKRFKPPGRKVVRVDTLDMITEGSLLPDSEYIVDSVSSVLKTALTLVSNGFDRIKLTNKENVEVIKYPQLNHDGMLRLDWIINRVRRCTPSETVLFVDSGSHRATAAMVWKALEPHTFFTSGTLAPMGWAICAAIGAKAARPSDPVLVVTGDGCMRMHGMEIATAVRYSLPVIYLVSNNSSYKSVRTRFEGGVQDSLANLPMISWADFARNLGAEGYEINTAQELDDAINKALVSGKTSVLDLRVSADEAFYTSQTLPGDLWPGLNDQH